MAEQKYLFKILTYVIFQMVKVIEVTIRWIKESGLQMLKGTVQSDYRKRRHWMALVKLSTTKNLQ